EQEGHRHPAVGERGGGALEQRFAGRVGERAADDQDARAAGGDPLERSLAAIDLVEAVAATHDGAQPAAGLGIRIGDQDWICSDHDSDLAIAKSAAEIMHGSVLGSQLSSAYPVWQFFVSVDIVR